MTWSAADFDCKAREAVLVTITSEEENEFARSICGGVDGPMTNEMHCWMGLKKDEGTGAYVWASGIQSSYTNWAEGQSSWAEAAYNDQKGCSYDPRTGGVAQKGDGSDVSCITGYAKCSESCCDVNHDCMCDDHCAGNNRGLGEGVHGVMWTLGQTGGCGCADMFFNVGNEFKGSRIYTTFFAGLQLIVTSCTSVLRRPSSSSSKTTNLYFTAALLNNMFIHFAWSLGNCGHGLFEIEGIGAVLEAIAALAGGIGVTCGSIATILILHNVVIRRLSSMGQDRYMKRIL